MEIGNPQNILLRLLRASDAERLVELCDNPKIWKNLRDSFPSPYTLSDAHKFIALCHAENPKVSFAIDYAGVLVGHIALIPQTDVHKYSAELGYWIGEPYWSRGIASKAVALIVEYGFITLKFNRIFAKVFDYNRASQRVLEKAGFKQEGILESSIFKDDIFCDEFIYGKVCPTIPSKL